MERRRLVLLFIVILVLAVGGATVVYFASHPVAWRDTLIRLGLTEPPDRRLVVSGFIEAEEVDIAPQIGGRVAKLYVEKGAAVSPGDQLVRLDGALLEARIEAARAGVAIAAAELAQAEAGARPEQVRQAEAELARAVAAREGAYQAWQDAAAIRDQPKRLNAEIGAARSAVQAAEAELAQASALKDAAVISHDAYRDARERWPEMREALEAEYQEFLGSLAEWEEAKRRLEDEYEDFWESDEWEELRRELEEWYETILKARLPPVPEEMPAQLSFQMIPYDYWRAWVGFNTAAVRRDQARTSLGHLLAIRQDPQALQARADAARAEYEQARAAVGRAEAQLTALRSGATREELAVLSASVSRAEAHLETHLADYDKLTLAAPVGGRVLKLSIHEGELAAPRVTLLTLGNLDEVSLTVYVPVDRLGQVSVGQTAQVYVDSFPEQLFKGRVVAIAHQAEFVPRNIQVPEERVSMVFAVDILIPNPHHRLKPGMPADATLFTEKP